MSLAAKYKDADARLEALLSISRGNTTAIYEFDVNQSDLHDWLLSWRGKLRNAAGKCRDQFMYSGYDYPLPWD